MSFQSTLRIVGFNNEVPTSILTNLQGLFVFVSLIARESCVHVISQLNREITTNY